MGIAGLVNGSAFEAPEWVDKSKPPGHTSQAKVYGVPGWWKTYPTLAFFFYSPNLLWFAVAATSYVLFPYDFEAGKTWAAGWMLQRLYVNLGIMLAYFGFWTVTLYVLSFSKRKFSPLTYPSLSRMCHNIYYSLLGTAQLAVFEVIFIHLYSTGKLSYVKDSEAFADLPSALKTIGWILFVPMWRELHFYIAHRFLHFRFLYKYVHSLHHRNTDIEPFAGLCMHPIEHLYYYSCVGPSLYIHASPFIFMWNAIHLLISPAASHSGWEDNLQSDQFHFLHHKAFECNYGTSGTPLDKWFGTFREKFGRSTEYKGEYAEESSADSDQKQAKKPEVFLRGGFGNVLAKSKADAVYWSFCVVMAATLYAAVAHLYGADKLALGPISNPRLIAALVAYGPIAFGFLLLKATGDKMSALWPFHKESWAGSTGLHVTVGYLIVIRPIYDMVYMLMTA